MRSYLRDVTGQASGKSRRCVLCHAKEKSPACVCDSYLCLACIALWKSEANALGCNCHANRRREIATEPISPVPVETTNDAPSYKPQPIVVWKSIQFVPLEPPRAVHNKGPPTLLGRFAIKETSTY
ncbi:hypothetical protein H257_17123 [Aphanomyces astaci]|uniref:Uncharacterized protein n=1 Tax=Aphanomyces astaci TaxID=112090 RepID=W4FI79_APHAT|nr:hypothetical protein H257_17123 [Aphanomyces astaci]ETV66458.1 hypothetical protein H257_17123 [Aphanomyces astaci]|eukprot:XP_009844092.1 hypothetical protein H257_17123 [Aphanomyces astaci]